MVLFVIALDFPELPFLSLLIPTVDVKLELKTGPNAMITPSRFVNTPWPGYLKGTPTTSESEQSTRMESAKHPACLIPSLHWTPLSLRGSMVGFTGFRAQKCHLCLFILYHLKPWRDTSFVSHVEIHCKFRQNIISLQKLFIKSNLCLKENFQKGLSNLSSSMTYHLTLMWWRVQF